MNKRPRFLRGRQLVGVLVRVRHLLSAGPSFPIHESKVVELPANGKGFQTLEPTLAGGERACLG